MNFVAFTIMPGAIPPVCLKDSKLLAIALHTSALAADITSDVYDCFNRLSGSVLHGSAPPVAVEKGYPKDSEGFIATDYLDLAKKTLAFSHPPFTWRNDQMSKENSL
jgi:hypothetical protein